MTDDPIIAELRKYREEHAAKFNYDLKAIVEDIHNFQPSTPETIIPAPPRPARRQKPDTIPIKS